LLAAPGLIVADCVAEAMAVAESVIVGFPATVSAYQTETVEDPLGIVAVVTAPPPDESANLSPDDDDETVIGVDPVVTGFPAASWRWTVMGPSVAFVDAVPETGPVVITNLEAVAATMLKLLVVASVRPAELVVANL
jgi:hypothetical protein